MHNCTCSKLLSIPLDDLCIDIWMSAMYQLKTISHPATDTGDGKDQSEISPGVARQVLGRDFQPRWSHSAPRSVSRAFQFLKCSKNIYKHSVSRFFCCVHLAEPPVVIVEVVQKLIGSTGTFNVELGATSRACFVGVACSGLDDGHDDDGDDDDDDHQMMVMMT